MKRIIIGVIAGLLVAGGTVATADTIGGGPAIHGYWFAGLPYAGEGFAQRGGVQLIARIPPGPEQPLVFELRFPRDVSRCAVVANSEQGPSTPPTPLGVLRGGDHSGIPADQINIIMLHIDDGFDVLVNC